MPDAAPAARGVYTPRRPQASPLFRLMSDHLPRLQTGYDDRFAREYGPWRPVVAQVAEKFLACGVLEHGFARIRCDACAHARISARVLLQVSLFLPQLPRQAAGDLDAVAGHHAPRARAAPTGGAHDPQAAARLLSIPSSPARRDRARRRPHRHRRHPDADRRARARGGHRRLLADARLARQLASAVPPATARCPSSRSSPSRR